MKAIYPLIIFTILTISCRKSDYYIENSEEITDLGGGTGTVTWTSDISYLIDGFVFVNDGQVLTIEAGTVIRAKTGQSSQASALIVAPGGKIIAEGTSSNPIIFTVEGDDLEGSVPLNSSGLWGGLIILGYAPINTESGEGFIEGIPVSEPRGVYGGVFPEDNSGILRYVSIRHGGTNIGEGNEINGLTLGGVGRKTTIDHVEVISNADDGIEFFGGTVNCKNLAVSFCGDDAFDFDEGYTGKCQFLLGITDDESGDHIAEHSGNSEGYLSIDPTSATIYNASFIGLDSSEEYMISFDYNSQGIYRNSIFLGNMKGISIENTEIEDCLDELISGKLSIDHNIVSGLADDDPSQVFRPDPDIGSDSTELQYLSDYFLTAGNQIINPGLDISTYPLDLFPPETVFSNMADYDNEWFETVKYKGAFGSYNWLEGWTLLDSDQIVAIQ